MTNESAGKMVLVKKSDGTFVRVPLSDIQKQTASSVQPAVVKSESAPSKPALVAQTSVNSNQKKNSMPIVKQVASTLPTKSKPQSVSVNKEDAISLLEEELPPVNAPLPKVSGDRAGDVSEVLKLLTFRVSSDQTNRLRTIVQLFLKDIRSAEQTRESLKRKPAEGGVGISEEQAEEVVAVAEEVLGRLLGQSTTAPQIPALKTALPKTLPPQTEKSMLADKPATIKEAGPRKIDVVAEAIKHSANDAASIGLSIKSNVAPGSKSNLQPEELFSLRQTSTSRPPMQDIVTKPITMGPLDEIRYITVTDFRRLATNPDEAAGKLRQKFLNLKEESILLFLDALVVWRSSPLYLDYMAQVCGALSKGQKLPLQNTDKKNMQWPEIKALVQMESALPF